MCKHGRNHSNRQSLATSHQNVRYSRLFLGKKKNDGQKKIISFLRAYIEAKARNIENPFYIVHNRTNINTVCTKYLLKSKIIVNLSLVYWVTKLIGHQSYNIYTHLIEVNLFHANMVSDVSDLVEYFEL